MTPTLHTSPPTGGAWDDAALIRPIAPAPAVAFDTRGNLPDAELFPGESEVVAAAVASRRQEFATARTCARKAMGLLRVLPAAVLPGPRGEPQWPRGVVGSITHCRGYRGAVLGRASQIAAIGIDAEPNEPLPDGVLSAIGSAEEFAWIDRLLAQEPDVRWDRLLFCMKEAVYKAWFPLAHCWLDFDAVVITVDVANTEFTAWLQIPGPTVHGRVLDRFTGRWQVLDGLILATIVLPVAGTCEPRDQVPEDGRRAGQEPANPSTPSRPAG